MAWIRRVLFIDPGQHAGRSNAANTLFIATIFIIFFLLLFIYLVLSFLWLSTQHCGMYVYSFCLFFNRSQFILHLALFVHMCLTYSFSVFFSLLSVNIFHYYSHTHFFIIFSNYYRKQIDICQIVPKAI